MPPTATIEFVNVIFRLLGKNLSAAPKGLITYTILETFNLKPENSIEVFDQKEDPEEKFLNALFQVKETTWSTDLEGFGKFKVFFLMEQSLTDKKNKLIDINSIKVMGLPLEAIPILEGNLRTVLDNPFYQKIGFDLETELNQVRVVMNDRRLGTIFDILQQQGMVLNRIEKGNTITLPSTVVYNGEQKQRNLLLQKTAKGGKIYLMLDATLSQPLLDFLTEGRESNSKKVREFILAMISKFFSASLQNLKEQGYEIPEFKFPKMN